ncbi:MAG: hypothetical protein JW800_01425 [Candidatus Omnitrophica bacterium]|nr:hypothetical protein [Candidatus Omnitrophota bacterium]
MEKALFITDIDQLFDDRAEAGNGKYNRLYYGIEFCERLIPFVDELRSALEYSKRNDLDFSLVTPYVTNDGLARLSSLFDYLAEEDIYCEVIVNDWGVLNLINKSYRGLRPVLGRLLTKQKRGPKIAELMNRKTVVRPLKDIQNPEIKGFVIQKKLPKESHFYYKGANSASVPIIHDFLINQRIDRIELDNTAQGLCLDLPAGKITASVYMPYVYITTTFFCPTAGLTENGESRVKIRPCSKECRKYIFRLRNDDMPKEIILKGNTQFYENACFDEEQFKKMNIDRIVYEAQVPV